MNILVPINDTSQIAEYVSVGASEFYMGFQSKDWLNKFGAFSDLNRMSGFGKDANQNSIDSIQNAVTVTHSFEASLYITINAAFYTEAQYRYLEQFFETLKEYGVDGVIVSNLRSVELANKIGLNPIASTMCGIYNKDIAKVYIDHGVKRIILPRDLSLDEINEITKDSCSEYEVFLMRSGCKFSDSFCLGFHRLPYGALCENLKYSKVSISGIKDSFEIRQTVGFNEACYNMLYQSEACGLCALYQLSNMNVHAVKIVGRAEKSNKPELFMHIGNCICKWLCMIKQLQS